LLSTVAHLSARRLEMTIEHQYLERSQRHIGIVDMVILAALAGLGYAVSSNLGAPMPAHATSTHTANKAMQQICSEEELRQMKSGPETCYLPINTDRHEFTLAPSSKEGTALRNAGRQAPSS
jgi:hypothetical protein